jgi:hypothetical protein
MYPLPSPYNFAHEYASTIDPHCIYIEGDGLAYLTPTQHKWVTDDEGKQTKVEVAKRVKRWWTASVDGKINLVVRYGSKPLEFAKGKNAIELASEAEVADTLRKVREAAELGELDALIEQQAQFGRRLTLKNK